MAARTLRIATRTSALALTQATGVARALEREGVGVQLIPLRTTGDERAGRPPDPDALAAAGRAGDKSRFVKEIEEALLAGEADLAVHSAKDVPGVLPEGLAIVGVPERADARDTLCGPHPSLDALPEGARVGTSSLRRRAQILARRPDLVVDDLRGNVDTRLRRLAEENFDAIVLAAAGLERLGRAAEGTPVAAEEMVPAPGQGCLALEARAGDERVADLAARLTDRDALVRLSAERAAVVMLDASCRTPVAAFAVLDGDALMLEAFAGMPDGSAWVRDTLEGSAEDPSALGRAVGERLVAAGAAEILAAAEAAPEAPAR